MKRTNSCSNPPVTRSVPLTIPPYLPANVRARTLVLASERERASGERDVKLKEPRVHALNPRSTGFLDIPHELRQQIIPLLDKKSVAAMASCGRLGYQYADALHPTRRLQGLINDFKRLRAGNLGIKQESVKAFLQAIAAGGDYDSVLLTPLSPAVRCAAAAALAIWTPAKINKKYREATANEIFDFFDQNFDIDFYNKEFEKILSMGMDGEKIRVEAVDGWANILQSHKIPANDKQTIFLTLLDSIGCQFKNLNAFIKIATENEITLPPVGNACLALSSAADRISDHRLLQQLKKMEDKEALGVMGQIFSHALIKGPPFFASEFTMFRTFLTMLYAIEKPSNMHAELLAKIAKEVTAFMAEPWTHLTRLETTFSEMDTSHEAVRERFYAAGTQFVGPMHSWTTSELLRLFIDKIVAFKNCVQVAPYVEQIFSIVRSSLVRNAYRWNVELRMEDPEKNGIPILHAYMAKKLTELN